MQCKEVEVVVEHEGLAPLPEAARAHVAGCRHCQDFVSDLASIVSVARELPAELEPPARVWLSLRAQLQQEGIIKEPLGVPAAEYSSWWQSFGDVFRSRAFATVAAGLLIVAAGILQLRQPDERPPFEPYATGGIATKSSVPQWQIPFQKTVIALHDQEIDLRNMQLAGTSAGNSPVDTSFKQNLQQVDQFIAECERHLNEAPQDELARDYLADAYQQKADLLSAMLDRGRSVD
jgi:hypothetical protein